MIEQAKKIGNITEDLEFWQHLLIQLHNQIDTEEYDLQTAFALS